MHGRNRVPVGSLLARATAQGVGRGGVGIGPLPERGAGHGTGHGTERGTERGTGAPGSPRPRGRRASPAELELGLRGRPAPAGEKDLSRRGA